MRGLVLAVVALVASGCGARGPISTGHAQCVPHSVELDLERAGLFDALANGTTIAPDAATSLPFDASVLPANESGAALQRLTWSAQVSMTNAVVLRSGDGAQLSLDVVAGTSNDTLRAWSRSLLENLTGRAGDALQASVDALLSHGTAEQPSFTTYHTMLPLPTTLARIFAQSGHRETTQIEHGANGMGRPGDVVDYLDDGWIFELHLPVRELATPQGNLTVRLTADEHDHGVSHVDGTTTLEDATNATARTLEEFGLSLPPLRPQDFGPICGDG